MYQFVLTNGVYPRREAVITAIKEYFQQRGWTVITPARNYSGMMSVIQHIPADDYMRRIEEFKRLANLMHDGSIREREVLEQTKDDKIIIIHDSGICDLFAYARLDPKLDEGWFMEDLVSKSKDVGYNAVFQVKSYEGAEHTQFGQPVAMDEVRRIEKDAARAWLKSEIPFTQVIMGDFDLNLAALLKEMESKIS